MTYRQRMSLFIFIDSCIILSSILVSQLLVTSDVNAPVLPLVVTVIAILLSHLFFAYKLKLYRKAWEYASIGELILILKTVTYSLLTTVGLHFLFFQMVYPRAVVVIWMMNLLIIGGSRFIWRIYRDNYLLQPKTHKRTLIIGAGAAGTMVARQLQNNRDTDLLPVAFIDDSPKKQRLDIFGIPVVGGVDQIQKYVEKFDVENIIIAIPSLSRKGIQNIFKECAKTNAKTQILPMLEDLVTGKVSVTQFRDVKVEDLLGRDPVDLDINQISGYVSGQVILVTGAGGSIGSEISRQIVKFKPRQLILLGHGENSIHAIEMELKEIHSGMNVDIRTEIADIQDDQKIMDIFSSYRPDVVYHAAAHKHVPLMERNPEEAVKNNVIGTFNVAKAASWSNAGRFVMISSDKAVNPTSVMGATKRLAEIIIQNMNKVSETKFVAVRFGNVLGSRGSVIPIFTKQIEKGGPVKVTHPDMVRFFMTIPEASSLVIQAGALTQGGEIFVLDMGEPVKIVDLAQNLIKLSGNNVDEIGVEFTGIRPGEKLYEELLKDEEVEREQVYPKIHLGRATDMVMDDIEDLIENYHHLDKHTLREQLLSLANNEGLSRPGSPVSITS
ncbi:nucleoside-diphosphate sugar epimerase/dehydratase [Halobacillus litoralis]|uniref:nucleoside-diphosphate sugar epimerase/dehydratase n=1 Tax=Halobacillus litoralis TaxID=45668 RepID=UPI001CFD2CF6|nr:nucleoside-diphosphate sugar epimerase/dehydratase [Halobacillus litoralis]WLR49126.1 nucleoside-diphosphate sugar epimerase/dehydratase [Halobacillus litoralis]